MAITQDLDVFLSAFGEDATHTAVGGSAVVILAIFDNEFASSQGLGIAGMDGSTPQALCKTSDVSDATRGASLSIGGVAYKVTEVMPDGTGMTTLRLSRD